jgi:DNA polymerase-3 subunit delta'
MALQLGAEVELVNTEIEVDLSQRANGTSVEQTIAILDAITQSRQRLASNVRDLLVLEALCTNFIFRGSVAA